MKRIVMLCAVVVCGLLAGCAAIEAENNSDKPIPPAGPNPFGDSFGTSAANPVGIGAAPVSY